MKGFKNKIVIITGGLGDLGFATAPRMKEEGCKVALFDMKPDTEKRASEINALFSRWISAMKSKLRNPALLLRGNWLLLASSLLPMPVSFLRVLMPLPKIGTGSLLLILEKAL